MKPVFDPIKCKTCEKILKKPVILPCGHSICQVHVDEAKTSNSDIKCGRCMESHSIHEKGFSLNKDLEALIENKLDSLDLGKEYNYAFYQSRTFAYFVKIFEKIKNQPDMRIHDYISQVKNEIDLNREELKNEIDQKCLSMIEKLEEFEKECIANVDSVKLRFDDKLDEKLNEWKNKSEQFTNDLRSFERSKWKKVKEEVDLHIKEIRSELYDFDESLFLNRFNEIIIENWLISQGLNTISIEVKELSKIKEDIKQSVDDPDMDLSLKVEIKKRDSATNKLWVDFKLASTFGFVIRKHKVEFEWILLNRFDKNKSLKNSHVIEFNNDGSRWILYSMKLDDLLNNNDLYNPEKDSFTSQVIIKKIEWIKP